MATFNVPASRGGTLWTVFELNGSIITPINSISYESPSSIQSTLYYNNVPDNTPVTDAEFIKNLPDKN